MTISITACADLHGNLPDNLPSADILIIAGDICPVYNHTLWFQEQWLNSTFKHWLIHQHNKFNTILGIFGNHDFISEEKPHLIPQDLPWIYLEEISTQLNINRTTYNVYGSSSSLVFHDWAWNRTEAQLEIIYSKIPDDTNILITHGPPYGIGDWVGDTKEHVGSESLLKRINELDKLQLVVAGHIHSGYGIYQTENGVTVANCSLLNEDYEYSNVPLIFELP